VKKEQKRATISLIQVVKKKNNSRKTKKLFLQ